MTRVVLALVTVRLLQAQYVVDTFAGSAGVGDGGPATEALFREPGAVVRDASGGYYIADDVHHAVRYVNPAGIISTVVGTPLTAGAGPSGQPGVRTAINVPAGVAVDSQGNVFFSEYGNCVVRKLDRQGVQTVVVGQVGRCANSTNSGAGTSVLLFFPTDITFDSQGRLLIVDTGNSVRRMDAAGNVTIVAGGSTGASDGILAAASRLNLTYGVAAGPDGSFYVVERGGQNRVRFVNSAGIISTVAGGTGTAAGGNAGDGGPATQATFWDLRGVALDATRNKLYLADRNRNRVRVVDLGTGTITNFAGQADGSPGYAGDGGPAAAASLRSPEMIRVEGDGALVIADRDNHVIRKVSATGIITTLAGRPRRTTESTARQVEFIDASDAAFDAAGNAYFTDRGNKVIRRITPQGQATTISSPLLTDPKGIGIDATGRIFVLDAGRLLQVVNGQVDSLFSFDLTVGGFIQAPARMAMDAPRNRIFFAIPARHQISMMNLSANPVSLGSFAGIGTAGFAGDAGQAAASRLNNPRDVAVDAAGNVYIADTGNNRLRRVKPDGVMETVFGNGFLPPQAAIFVDGFGDFGSPSSVAVDNSGRVVFSDLYHAIRRFDPAARTVKTVAAGIVVTPLPTGASTVGLLFDGRTSDGGDSLSSPVPATWVRSDAVGNLYFGTPDNRVRYLRPYQVTGIEIANGDNQSAEVSSLLPGTLVARVITNVGPIADIVVAFRIRSGSATLTPLTAWYSPTDSTGQSRVRVNLGATAGEVRIDAAVGTTHTVTFKALALPAGSSANRPVIRATGGVITAAAFGGGTAIASGSWIEIYGTNLSATSRSWDSADFQGSQAPVALDGVRVSIGGRDAFVAYISPTQINAQVPDGIAAGLVDVIVSTAANGPSTAIRVTAAATAPGLLAPGSFNIGGTQYAVAIHQDGAYVGRPDLIPGAPFRAAKAGDVLVLYGVGFGATSPASPSGLVVPGAAPLTGVTIGLGDQDAQVLFAGLAQGAVGLYQFNIVVPAGFAAGDVPVSVRLRGTALNQALSLTIGQ